MKEGSMKAGRGHRLILLAALGALVLAGAAVAVNPNEREVKPQRNVQDPDEINNPDGRLWVLDFKFKDPRLIKVNVPGRGQKVCWYLWYQVINYTGNARLLIPDFELKTNDTNMLYHDEILPTVESAIRAVEDPTGYLQIKNSVTISSELIPPSKPEASPKPVTGVAIWMDPNEPNPGDDEKTRKEKEKKPKLADSNRYSIFVAGLSNGWSVTDPVPPDTKPVVRRKTLQLNFQRLGDKYYMKSEEIRWVPPAQWIYRGSALDVPGLPAAVQPPAPPPQN
jgi:hypothetical protein